MNKLILAVAVSMLATQFALAQAATPAAAEKKPAATAEKKAPSEKQVKQQERMKACNKEASDKKLKGDGRKQFMSGCLKAAAPAEAKAATPATPAALAKKQ